MSWKTSWLEVRQDGVAPSWSVETLAGRISSLELSPLDALEVEGSQLDRLWVRGGIPSCFLASKDAGSFKGRQNFIRTYLERDM